MLRIVAVLGVSWGVGDLVYQYLMGNVWWAWFVDAGFLVAGIITGGTLAAIKTAIKIGLKQSIKKLTKQKAIAL